MASVSPTVTEVVPSASAKLATKTANVTIAAGDVLYLDAGGRLAKAITTTALTAAAVGIAATGSSNNQPCLYVTRDGALNLGATAALPAGKVLFVSDTAGAMENNYVLLTTGDFITVIGVGVGNNAVSVNFENNYLRGGQIP